LTLHELSRTPTGLEQKLGYQFQDEALLQIALTPPSAGLACDNQRLEFLGDSVLHLCVSLLVYREHPDWPEGPLSKLRGLMVCADALHEWALELGVKLEKGPRSPRKAGAGDRNARADAMEAILAAVFLDQKGSGSDPLAAERHDPLAAVFRIVEGRFLGQIKAAYEGIWETKDSKTTLQERGAVLAMPPPAYELIEQTGPDHAPTFRVRVRMGTLEAEASAGTLKGAQAEAARLLLLNLPAPGNPAS
jgi:ribonuclease-3